MGARCCSTRALRPRRCSPGIAVGAVADDSGQGDALAAASESMQSSLAWATNATLEAAFTSPSPGVVDVLSSTGHLTYRVTAVRPLARVCVCACVRACVRV